MPGYENRDYRFVGGLEYRVEMDSVTNPEHEKLLKRSDPYHTEYQEQKERAIKDFEKRLGKMNVSYAEREKRKEIFLMTL